MTKKYTAQEANARARAYCNEPTKHNANCVMEAMDKLCRWHVERRHYLIKNSRITYDDLLQEARLGVWIALQKYDPEKGSFPEYSKYWMSQRIMRHIDTHYHLVKFPTKQRYLQFSYARLLSEYKASHPLLSIEEIHELIHTEQDIPIEDLKICEHKKYQTESLDAPVFKSDDTKTTTIDMLDTDTDTDTEQHFNDNIDMQRALAAVKRVISKLSDRKQNIANTYLLAGEGTMQQLADIYNISRQRIEQIIGGCKNNPSGLREEIIFKTRVELGIR